MTTTTTIGFIGLGLIGGSLAKTIRKKHPDFRIMAYDADRETLANALREEIIDISCEARDARLAECDYIFLCAPVEFNVKYLEFFRDMISPNCILSDVGSVKGTIHEAATRLGLAGNFIGGHPMAGSERSGFANSTDHLLENVYYILTPSEEIPLDKLASYTEFISSLGAIPLVLTPDEHDYITAGVSHIPHVIAASLVNLIQELDDASEHMKLIAAGGFRDITRIASSSPVMWEQIRVENSSNISAILDTYIRLLIQAKCNLDAKNGQELRQMFSTSRDYRDSMDVTAYGPLKKAYMIYCDLEDETGAIATIATILAMANISIKNIGIIHNREFEQGVLKIEFYDGQALKEAAALLGKRNYIIYER